MDPPGGRRSTSPASSQPVHRSKSTLEDADLKEKVQRVQRRYSNPEGDVSVCLIYTLCLFVSCHFAFENDLAKIESSGPLPIDKLFYLTEQNNKK